MDDLLKEAIADAKAVRETALQNAKMALEEAFTPQLKSMLSAKLREEDDELEGEEVPAEEQDEFGGEEDAGGEEEEAVDETIEVNGVRYAPIKEEGNPEDDDNAYDEKADKPDKTGGGLAEGEPEAADNAYGEKASKDDKNDGISNSTLAEQEDDEDIEIDENLFKEEDEEEGEEVTEQSDSSDIGKGDNVVKQADGSDEEDPGQGKLAEYKKAVIFLKNKLHEVNILNAKLLFTNKLFKEFSLDNNQKLKVVETFDRTQSTREIKLVYSTLAEQFSDNGSIGSKKSIKESASARTGSTKPKRKIISESAQVANRFKKLAGIIK